MRTERRLAKYARASVRAPQAAAAALHVGGKRGHIARQSCSIKRAVCCRRTDEARHERAGRGGERVRPARACCRQAGGVKVVQHAERAVHTLLVVVRDCVVGRHDAQVEGAQRHARMQQLDCKDGARRGGTHGGGGGHGVAAARHDEAQQPVAQQRVVRLRRERRHVDAREAAAGQHVHGSGQAAQQRGGGKALMCHAQQLRGDIRVGPQRAQQANALPLGARHAVAQHQHAHATRMRRAQHVMLRACRSRARCRRHGGRSGRGGLVPRQRAGARGACVAARQASWFRAVRILSRFPELCCRDAERPGAPQWRCAVCVPPSDATPRQRCNSAPLAAGGRVLAAAYDESDSRLVTADERHELRVFDRDGQAWRSRVAWKVRCMRMPEGSLHALTPACALPCVCAGARWKAAQRGLGVARVWLDSCVLR